MANDRAASRSRRTLCTVKFFRPYSEVEIAQIQEIHSEVAGSFNKLCATFSRSETSSTFRSDTFRPCAAMRRS